MENPFLRLRPFPRRYYVKQEQYNPATLIPKTKHIENEHTMKKNITSPAAAITAAIDEKHKLLITFESALKKFEASRGTFKEKIVSTVTALRLEGYTDDVIKTAMRAVVQKVGCSPQMLNLVFRTPVDQGGCGMAAERNPAENTESKNGKPGKPGKPGKTPPASKVQITGGKPVKLTDAAAVYAALMVQLGGNNLAIMALAEKIYGLASEAASKGIGAKPAK